MRRPMTTMGEIGACATTGFDDRREDAILA
jgi:hypothetical protein